MLMRPPTCEFGSFVDNVNPSNAASFGTVLTAPTAADTWTGYDEIIAAADFTKDAYGILVQSFHTGGSASPRTTFLDVAETRDGGTNYTTLLDRLLTTAATTTYIGRQQFFFPLFIKSGASIRVRCQQANASAWNGPAIRIVLFCEPSDPEHWRTGSYVESIGVGSVASAAGTIFTPGTTSDGAWQSLGTTTKACWYWQTGRAYDTTGMAGQTHREDFAVGDGTNYDIIIPNRRVMATSTEVGGFYDTVHPMQCVREVPAVATLYYRGQCSSTPGTYHQAAAYGLGG